MNLGFIILAHNQPASIRRLAGMLAADGNRVVVHFDSSASAADKREVQQIASEHPGRIQVISKVHCVWGEWSLVEAVLRSLDEFRKMPDPPDYIHLMSAADFPIRPLADLKEFLRRNPGSDFIECCDITKGQWVKGGLGRERLRFYFPFNFRTSRRAFDRMVRWQRKLKIRRKMPLGMTPHMGSQWWTLRWSTCAKLLDFVDQNPKVVRFFRTTWIPDESFFQTVIARIIPNHEIANLQLMFHHLGPSGRPYTFYNDHLPVIHKLPHFFIRKVSPAASELYGEPVAGRRIPKRRHLIRARDLLRAAIDRNHRFAGAVPGHLSPLLEPRTLTEPRPLLLFLVPGPQQVAGLEALTHASPACLWLGRPFAPGCLEMPREALLRTGLTEQSWKLRDDFIHEFIHHLVSSPEAPRVATAALVLGEDEAHLKALGMLPGLIPIVVSDPPLQAHRKSRLAGRLHAASPALHARLIYSTASGIPAILEDLAQDPSVG